MSTRKVFKKSKTDCHEKIENTNFLYFTDCQGGLVLGFERKLPEADAGLVRTTAWIRGQVHPRRDQGTWNRRQCEIATPLIKRHRAG